MSCNRVPYYRFIGLIAILLIWLAQTSSFVLAADVTNHIESLGIALRHRYPSGETVYARNVWDLQVYAGRIYVGGGNSNNKGPAPNAGPVPILAWDPQLNQFICEGQVDDEEISRFDVIDGKLYIPGADPRESWELGNIYRRGADGSWRKLRTIPRAIHTYALAGYQGRLYAGLKITHSVPWYVDFKGYGAAVAVSEDAGESWTLLRLGGYAVLNFLQAGDHLYAMDLTLGPRLKKWIEKQDREKHYAPVYELEPSENMFTRRPDLDGARLFPETPEARARAFGIQRSVSFGASSVYIGSAVGLYRADSLQKGDVRTSRIALPEGTRPRDLLVRHHTVFVLLQGPADKSGVQVRVLASRDWKIWEDLLHFTAPAFARSFEILEGDIYFGLGCDVKSRSEWQQKQLHPLTGSLLRIQGRFSPLLEKFLNENTPSRS